MLQQIIDTIKDKFAIEICFHEWLEYGKSEVTVYRVIEKEEDRNKPISQDVIAEINRLISLKYLTGLSWRQKWKLRRGQDVGVRYPFKISPKGLTASEIEARQNAWNLHCDLMNDACG